MEEIIEGQLIEIFNLRSRISELVLEARVRRRSTMRKRVIAAVFAAVVWATLVGVAAWIIAAPASTHDGYHPFPSEVVAPLPPVRGVPPGYVPPRLRLRPRLPSLGPSRAERYAPEGWYVDPEGGIVWIWPAP